MQSGDAVPNKRSPASRLELCLGLPVLCAAHCLPALAFQDRSVPVEISCKNSGNQGKSELVATEADQSPGSLLFSITGRNMETFPSQIYPRS